MHYKYVKRRNNMLLLKVSDSDDDDEPLARRVSCSEDSEGNDDIVRNLKILTF